MNKSIFATDENFVKITTNKLEVKSLKQTLQVEPFKISYLYKPKNIIMTYNFRGNTVDKIPHEISFYFRYVDADNYGLFSMKNGNEIRFEQKVSGKVVLYLDYIKISKDNIFTQKSNFIISIFEESLTVLIDGATVMQIEHLSEFNGDYFIIIDPGTAKSLDFSFDKLKVSEEIVSFEPILMMNKSSSVYFMEANHFYEQDAYELALYYYKKGVLYGSGDDKIYNRIGNLQFLIENYPSAEFYYRLAKEQNPTNIEYIANYTRSLIKQGKTDAFIPLITECLENNSYTDELLLDYSGFLTQRKDWAAGKDILERIKNSQNENTAFQTKYGRVLMELGDIDSGKEYLISAANKLMKIDPSSAVILLHYLLERSPDVRSLSLITEILYDAHEMKEIEILLRKFRDGIVFNGYLTAKYCESLISAELYSSAWQETEIFTDLFSYPEIILSRIKAGIELKKIDIVEPLIQSLFNNKDVQELYFIRLAMLIFRFATVTGREPVHMKELYDAADKNDPEYSLLEKEYAKILVDKGEYSEALKLLEKLITLYPDDMELTFNIAIALDAIGDWSGAIYHLRKVYSLTNAPDVVYLLAHSLFYASMYNDALEIIKTNYDRLPDDGRRDNLTANIYLALENPVEAIRFYYKALEVDRENDEYAINLSEAFYRNKEYANCHKITSQLLEFEIDRAMALHYKCREHLFYTISCSGCGVSWDIVKESLDNTETVEIDNKVNNKIAGTCPKCGKIYCDKCAESINDTGEMCCPDDKTLLSQVFQQK